MNKYPGFTSFSWRGEPIKDIEAWAKERNERMVKYRARRQTPYGPEEHEGSMPESFWNHLMWGNDWTYEEI